MASELRDLMANLELSLVETVGVLDREQRIGALHDALAFVADSIAAGSALAD